MALTAKVIRTWACAADKVDEGSGVFTDTDIYYPGAILVWASGKLAVAATAQNQVIAGIFTGESSDGDRSDAKTIGSSNTIRGVVHRGKAWLPVSGCAQTDVGGLYVNSSDDAMVAVPTTATTRYFAYLALDFKTGYLLFDLREPILVVRET
jgi:hypothetical protein